MTGLGEADLRCSRGRTLPGSALAGSVDRHHSRETRPQPALQGMARIEHDLHRDALHHFGEVSSGIIRRQKSELRSTGGRDLSHFSMQHDPGEGINRDVGDISSSACW